MFHVEHLLHFTIKLQHLDWILCGWIGLKVAFGGLLILWKITAGNLNWPLQEGEFAHTSGIKFVFRTILKCYR